jgi:hypothetical protein
MLFDLKSKIKLLQTPEKSLDLLSFYKIDKEILKTAVYDFMSAVARSRLFYLSAVARALYCAFCKRVFYAGCFNRCFHVF